MLTIEQRRTFSEKKNGFKLFSSWYYTLVRGILWLRFFNLDKTHNRHVLTDHKYTSRRPTFEKTILI